MALLRYNPSWHKREYRKRLRARVAAKTPWTHSKLRLVKAYELLNAHHGSIPPKTLLAAIMVKAWDCVECGTHNSKMKKECGACWLPKGGWSCPQCKHKHPTSHSYCGCGYVKDPSTKTAATWWGTSDWCVDSANKDDSHAADTYTYGSKSASNGNSKSAPGSRSVSRESRYTSFSQQEDQGEVTDGENEKT